MVREEKVKIILIEVNTLLRRNRQISQYTRGFLNGIMESLIRDLRIDDLIRDILNERRIAKE